MADVLSEMGFTRLQSDANLYVKKEGQIYILVYVDALLMTGPHKLIKKIIALLKDKFHLKITGDLDSDSSTLDDCIGRRREDDEVLGLAGTAVAGSAYAGLSGGSRRDDDRLRLSGGQLPGHPTRRPPSTCASRWGPAPASRCTPPASAVAEPLFSRETSSAVEQLFIWSGYYLSNLQSGKTLKDILKNA